MLRALSLKFAALGSFIAAIKVMAINVDRKAKGTNIAAASDTIHGHAITIRHQTALKMYMVISASNTSLKMRVT